MNCIQSNEYMMKYLDGELIDSEHAELIHHINKCSVCCAEFQEYNSIVKSLEEDKGIEPPDDFEITVMRRISLMDDYKKLKKEKNLILLYFLSSILFSLGIIVCAVFMKDYVLEILKYVGIPTGITYTVYGILSNIENAVKLLIRFVYCFDSMFSDIYYVLIGLFVIAAMSKIYNKHGEQNNDNKVEKALQNE